MLYRIFAVVISAFIWTAAQAGGIAVQAPASGAVVPALAPPAEATPEAASEQMPPPEALAEPHSVVLAAGTEVEFETLEDLSSKTSYLGERFNVVTARDQVVSGGVLIPAGTWGKGEISLMVRKGGWGKPGRIDVRLVTMTLGDRQVALGGTQAVRAKSGAAETVLAAAAVGIYSFAVTGKSAVLPAGAVIMGIVKQDVTLVPMTAADPPPAAAAADVPPSEPIQEVTPPQH